MSSSSKNFKASDQVHVNIRDDLTIKTFGRPPTNIGAQGSHISAYHLIEMLVISLQQYSGIEEAMKRIFSFFSNLHGNIEVEEALIKKLGSPEKDSEDISEYREQLILRKIELTQVLIDSKNKMDICLEEIQQNSKYAEDIKKLIYAGSQTRNPTLVNITDVGTLCKAVDQKFSSNNYNETIEDLIKSYLTIGNKMPYTAFPTEGNLGSVLNEGAIIKSSCCKLSKSDGHLGINLEMKHTTENIEKLSDGVAQQMLNLFWFPRIPEDKLIDLTDSEEKLLWEKISSAKKYISNVLPRSNNLNILRDVVCNHIDLIFNCFNNISANKEIANKILNKFILLVSKNGMIAGEKVGWELDNETTRKLENSVVRKLYATGAYQPESPENSKKQSTPSSGTSGEVTPEHRSSSDEDYKPSTPDEDVAEQRSPYNIRNMK